MSKILLSGIRPSNKSIHLGNYFGFLKFFIESEVKEKIIFSADLHSLTTEKEINSFDILKTLYVLLEDKVLLFRQSKFPQISQLSWFLSCNTNIGFLNRFTQFKEKSKENPNSGLLFYPILMAADIGIHCISDEIEVPVGEDQEQHLNYIIDMFEIFNKTYGKVFNIPKKNISKGLKIKSLISDNKMSKSEPNGAIFFSDSDLDIKLKINKAVTDNLLLPNNLEELKSRKNIYNLYLIYKLITKKNFEEIIEKYKGKGIKILKNDLSDILINFIKPIREKVEKISNIKDILEKNEKLLLNKINDNLNFIQQILIK